MAGLDVLLTSLGDLFLKYTFGDVWMGGIFAMFIMIYIGWKLHLSADGWVVNLAGMGILFGTYYFSSIGFLPIILICLGFLAYFLLKRIFRGY